MEWILVIYFVKLLILIVKFIGWLVERYLDCQFIVFFLFSILGPFWLISWLKNNIVLKCLRQAGPQVPWSLRHELFLYSQARLLSIKWNMLNKMERIALNNKAPNVKVTSTRLVLTHELVQCRSDMVVDTILYCLSINFV